MTLLTTASSVNAAFHMCPIGNAAGALVAGPDVSDGFRDVRTNKALTAV
jgi:hypothetical protein